MPAHEFAQRQMQKYGWSKGKGLGKSESGRTSAIKVKLKNNSNGLGLDEGEEFTFHWWDHIFNKAASSFKVNETNENEVVIEKCEGEKVKPFLVSNKKPFSREYNGQPLLYGTFVKAGTYNASEVKPAVYISDGLSDVSSEDEDDDDEDKSLLTNDTLEKMFKKTGLTGHKAARHGHSLNGKLQRLQRQEEAKETLQQQSGENIIQDENQNIDDDKTVIENNKSKKKKKKKKLDKLESSFSKLEQVFSDYGKLNDDDSEVTDIVIKSENQTTTTTTTVSTPVEVEVEEVHKKKKKKRKVDHNSQQMFNSPVATCFSKLSASVNDVTNKLKLQNKSDETQSLINNQVPKKKKKKRTKSVETL